MCTLVVEVALEKGRGKQKASKKMLSVLMVYRLYIILNGEIIIPTISPEFASCIFGDVNWMDKELRLILCIYIRETVLTQCINSVVFIWDAFRFII